jgi:hypothetical protein
MFLLRYVVCIGCASGMNANVGGVIANEESGEGTIPQESAG